MQDWYEDDIIRAALLQEWEHWHFVKHFGYFANTFVSFSYIFQKALFHAAKNCFLNYEKHFLGHQNTALTKRNINLHSLYY